MIGYIWEYSVKVEKREEFVRMYGAEGDWVRFFRDAAGYVETRLLGDVGDSSRFMTIDIWESPEARKVFYDAQKELFEAHDRRGEELTDSEVFLGEFVYLGRAPK